MMRRGETRSFDGCRVDMDRTRTAALDYADLDGMLNW
jgi:hypothetical protein